MSTSFLPVFKAKPVGLRCQAIGWMRCGAILIIAASLLSTGVFAQTQRTVTMLADPTNGNPAFTPNNLNKYPPHDGEFLTIGYTFFAAAAPASCVFAGWTENGDFVNAPPNTASPSYSFTVAGDRTYVALFTYSDPTTPKPQPWTDGVIPFVFGADVTPAHQQTALEEMRNWTFETGCKIAFVPWKGSPDSAPRSLLKILNNTDGGTENFTSPVGMPSTSSGSSQVKIVSWDQPGKIDHELGHALGLRHAQQRPDRNKHISVQWGNFTNPATSVNPQYAVMGQSGWMDGTYIAGEPYDLLSIMHYPPKENQSSPAVMTAKPGEPNANLWNTPGFIATIQQSDIIHIQNAYGVNGESRFVDNTRTGGSEDGSISDPYRNLNTGAVYNAQRHDQGSRLWVAPGTYTYGGTRIEGPQKILPYPGGGPVRIVR